MTNQQIIDFLKQFGYLSGDYEGDSIDELDVQSAIARYQSFEGSLERLAHEHHSRSLVADGAIGPATIAAMSAPRCGHTDSDASMEAQGTGNWPGCHGVGNFHRALVSVNESGMGSHLRPVFWDQVVPRVVKMYREMGMDFVFKKNASGANIQFSFVQRSSGWIGLAVVGTNQRCSDNIWCRYLATYRPSNVVNEWTTLVAHELGHNTGLRHSSGGVMNPSIVRGLPPSWRNDPSESILRRWFGGEPYVPDDPEPEPPPVDLESRVRQLEIEQVFTRSLLNDIVQPKLNDHERRIRALE